MMLMMFLLLANALCDGFTSMLSYTKSMSVEYTHIHSHISNAFIDEQGDDAMNDISISVQRILPNITQHEARNAWIEFHWIKGGGLPIAILNKDNSIIQTTTNNENRILERTILPIFMKERLEYDDNDTSLQYRVTEAGPFFADLVDGSPHSASVSFDSIEKDDNTIDNGCIMTWNVTFATTRLASVYEKVTQFTVGTAATTVQEAAAIPRLFTMSTTINGSSLKQQSIDPIYARRQCLDFIFAKGGGLPIPPPIPFGDVLSEGNGLARQKLLRIPPIIVESIVDTKTTANNEMAEFTYQLNNPGWLTFPFLLHTHLGRIQFTSVPSSTSSSDPSSTPDLLIHWEVEIRPYKFASTIMEKLVEMTVSTILRNLRIHLIEPDAQVIIKPPRGGNTESISFGTINKDTWLGGVLDTHLSDTRSTLDQTISLFQPWKWGRSGDGDEEDNVQFKWTDGRIN